MEPPGAGGIIERVESEDGSMIHRAILLRVGAMTCLCTVLHSPQAGAQTPEPLAYPDLPASHEVSDHVEHRLAPRPTAIDTSVPILPTQPDIIGFRIGNFQPTSWQQDLYSGSFTASENSHFRFDIKFKGRVNPPGPVTESVHNPTLYGPNPLLGNVEFNVDTANTGAELDRPQDCHLGVYSRFGCRKASLQQRNPRNYDQATAYLGANPDAAYTGTDFVLNLNGSLLNSSVPIEGDQNGNGLFDNGETWVLTGSFFCRANGYEIPEFWSGGYDGRYCPETKVRFSHNATQDTTEVSFVYPLKNLVDPINPDTGENFDFDAATDNSVEEALLALALAAQSLSGVMEDYVIEDWQTQNPYSHLNSSLWAVHTAVGTTYALAPADHEKMVWTDFLPKRLPGDLNGDGLINDVDANQFAQFRSGDYNLDGVINGADVGEGAIFVPHGGGRLEILEFPRQFSIYDKNYDGFVDHKDHPRFSLDHLDLFFSAYQGPGQPPAPDLYYWDANHDNAVDLRDVQALQIQFSRLP